MCAKNSDRHLKVMRRRWPNCMDGEGEVKGRRLMFTSDGGSGWGRSDGVEAGRLLVK